MYRSSLRTSIPASVLSLSLVANAITAQTSAPLSYPAATRGTQVDVYHGTSVADPYRWLEDVDSPATTAWVAAQNRLTDSFLASIPQRETIRARLPQLWTSERCSVPFKESAPNF